MPTVSLLILAWPPYQAQRLNVFTLLDCLPASRLDLRIEVVVVCNGNDPVLESKLTEHPRVDLVLTPGLNLGVAAGWNAAAERASGDVLIFANEDVIFGPDTVRQLVAAVSEKNVGLAGVEASVWDRNRIHAVRRGWDGPPANLRDPQFPVVAGYLFAIPKMLWKAIGGVDSRLSPAFFEEVDLALRVRRAGYALGLIPEADVRHPWGISRAGPRTRIDWAGGSESVFHIHQRNHRLMLDLWSSRRWRSHPALHVMIYRWARAQKRMCYLIEGARARVGRTLGRERSYSRRMVRGVVSGALTIGLTKFGGLLALPLLLNLLGLPLYGAWAIATVFIGSQGLFDLGMATATVRYVAEADAHNDGATARRVVLLSLAFYTLLSIAVGGLVLPFTAPIIRAFGVPVNLQVGAGELLIGAVGLFAISNYTLVCKAALQGLQRLEVVNVATLAGQAAYLGLLLIAWQRGWGTSGVLVAVLGLYLTQTAPMAIAVLRHIPRGLGISRKVEARSLLSYGWKVQTIVLADSIALQAPKLLAGFLLGVSAAGRLDLALRLPLAASAIVLPILPPLLPAASRLSALNDAAALQALSDRAMRYVAVVTLPVFAGVFAFGPQLLHQWLGPSAAHLDLSIRLLTIALAAHTLPGVATALAMGTGFPGLVVRYKLVLMLVTATLLPAAAKLGGIDGISGAVLIGFVVSFFYLNSKIQVVIGSSGRRQMELALLRATGAAIAAAVLGGISYWGLVTTAIPYATWFSAGLAFTAYVVFIVRVGVLDIGDILDLIGRPNGSRLLRFSRRQR